MKWQGIAGLGVSVAFHIAVVVSLALLVTVNPSDSSRKVPIGLKVVDKKAAAKEAAAMVQAESEPAVAGSDREAGGRRKAGLAATAGPVVKVDSQEPVPQADQGRESGPASAALKQEEPVPADVGGSGAVAPEPPAPGQGGESMASHGVGLAGIASSDDPDEGRCVGACGGRGVQGGGSADTARNPSPGSAGGDDGTGRYALMVRKLLERRGAYPGTARRLGLEGLVRMTVTVDADGSILDTEIERSSGFRELDQAALASARDVSGLPPPPGGRPLRILIPVRFSMRRL